MDFSKSIRFPISGRPDSQRKSPKIDSQRKSPKIDSQRKSPKTMMNVSHESNENFSTPNASTSVTPITKNEPKNLKSPYTSPMSQKRILTEKNHLSNSVKKTSPQKKTDKPLPISTNGSRPDSPYPLPYDPVTNYTSPRPEFLRYDPNRRMEIMQRIEKVMFDDEEGLSPCTFNGSTSPQVSAEKATLEEEPSHPTSTVTTAVPQEPSQPTYVITVVPPVPVPECGEEECLIDDEEEEEEEGISYVKLVLKLFFLAIFVSSVCYTYSMSSNVGMKLRERTSEVSKLGEIIGLSKMCLSRRNPAITCGIEEWAVAMEGAIPKVFDIIGFTSEEEDVFTDGDVIGSTPDEEDVFTDGDVIDSTPDEGEMFSDGDVIGATPEEEEMFGGGVVMDVRKETDEIEIGIGLLAQGNIVESSEVDLHAVGDTQILERSKSLKMQVYLLYSMLALAATLSVLVPLIASLHKHTSKMFYRKKKQTPTSETDVLKGSGAVKTYTDNMSTPGAVKTYTDNMSTPVAGNSKMHVIQTAEVDLLGESSFTDTTMFNGSSVKEVELRAAKISQSELELQATPRTPIPEASLDKFERSTNRRESAKTEVTSLRRSNRLRSRLTSP